MGKEPYQGGRQVAVLVQRQILQSFARNGRSVNFAALEAFAERGGREFRVLHLSGRRDHDELAQRLAVAPHRDGYALVAYDPAGLGEFLAAADLVLGRSGGSIFEVTAAGRPAILVPYPHATGDHQTANAAWMERAGAATVLPDSELGGEGGPGTNPEQPFSVGYAACFHSGLLSVAQGRKLDASDSTVTAHVGIGPTGRGGFGLAVALDLHAPHLSRVDAEDLMRRAHALCPYSNATRGNVDGGCQ